MVAAIAGGDKQYKVHVNEQREIDRLFDPIGDYTKPRPRPKP